MTPCKLRQRTRTQRMSRQRQQHMHKSAHARKHTQSALPSSLSLPKCLAILISPLPPADCLSYFFLLMLVCMLCVTVGYCCLFWPGHWKRCLITMMIIIFQLIVVAFHFKMSMHFSALNNSKSYLITDLNAYYTTLSIAQLPLLPYID